jgi:hypothetical protein
MKIFIGHNNWLSGNLQLENNQVEKFEIEFHLSESVKDLSFDDAADYTAKLISQKYQNIHLLLSGGLDSEFVAKVFVRNNLKFTPVILVNQTNIPEVWYAFNFCIENKLDPIVLDYSQSYQDHTKLLKMIFDLSLKLKIPPNLSVLPNFVSTVIKDANLLTGYGDTLGKRPDNHYQSYLEPVGNELTIDGSSFYLHLRSNQHPGAFFVYTPEIFKSYLLSADCSKPAQIAKSNLYNVIPRSKIVLDLHLISDSPVLKGMIEKRLEDTKRIENEVMLDKNKILKLL